MTKRVDAIIIGAGVIGGRSRSSWPSAATRRSTSTSCRAPATADEQLLCDRPRPLFLPRGVAMAYEGYFYWKDWQNYLGVADDPGIAKYMNCGTVLLKSATGHHKKVLKHDLDLGVEYEEWDRHAGERIPVYAPTRSGRPSAWMTPSSGRVRAGSHRRDLYSRIGIHQRPAALQPQPAARRRGQRRRVPVPCRGGRDPPPGPGVRHDPDGGEQIDAPILVNVAGPHSYIINRMADVEKA